MPSLPSPVYNLPMKNIILIGMPGSGKSTLGVILAKALGWDFVDMDLLIQQREGRLLQDILQSEGYLALRACEEDALLTLRGDRQVIATGGSAVYSYRGMEHLKNLGKILYLQASPDTLKKRVTNWGIRGIAAPPGTSLERLYSERTELYEKYAQSTIPVDDATQEKLVETILFLLNEPLI